MKTFQYVVRLLVLLSVVCIFEGRDAFAIPLGTSLSLELPHPLNLSFEMVPLPDFSASVSLGGLPTITVNPAGSSGPISGSILSPNAHFRWHPWSGAFFVGTILGHQTVSGSTTQTISLTSPAVDVPTQISLSMSSVYITPHLGWAWGINSPGLFGGVEFGLQIPASSSSQLDVSVTDPAYAAYASAVQSSAQYQRAVNDVENLIDRIGRLKLPYAALRIGWYF